MRMNKTLVVILGTTTLGCGCFSAGPRPTPEAASPVSSKVSKYLALHERVNDIDEPMKMYGGSGP